MLEVRSLRAGYGGARRCPRGSIFRSDAGEIVAVLGSNGVGKTTLNNKVLPASCGRTTARSASTAKTLTGPPRRIS